MGFAPRSRRRHRFSLGGSVSAGPARALGASPTRASRSRGWLRLLIGKAGATGSSRGGGIENQGYDYGGPSSAGRSRLLTLVHRFEEGWDFVCPVPNPSALTVRQTAAASLKIASIVCLSGQPWAPEDT